MNSHDRAELAARLAPLDPHERRKLTKRAAALRQSLSARAPKRRVRSEEDEPCRRGSPSLDEALLRLLREEAPPAPAVGSVGGAPDGLVVALAKGRAWIATPDGEISAELAPEIRAAQERLIAVGDEVVLAKGRVSRVLPRRTRLSRPDPGSGGERVVVANIDAAVIVVSVTAPPLHPRLIDRYLLACDRGGVAPVLAVNKWDLLSDGPPDQERLLDPYRAFGLPVIPVSADRGTGLNDLRATVAGRLVAFVGHSGVGKSSLVNALAPGLALETGAVAPGRGTGRHTTRGSRLYAIGLGTRVIDTPGVRAFGLWDVGAEALAEGFPEFAGLECRFRDCRHEGEPGCGLALALERGEVREARAETYRRLLASLREEG